jgi:hypothetical protein
MKTFKLGNLTFYEEETGELKKALKAGRQLLIKAGKQRDKQLKKFLKSKAAKKRF